MGKPNIGRAVEIKSFEGKDAGLDEASRDVWSRDIPETKATYEEGFREDGFEGAANLERWTQLTTADFMTGGNRTHNKRIYEMVTQEVIRILETERQQCLCAEQAAQIREFVHQEANAYKDNSQGRRNGNAGSAGFSEILETALAHFGGPKDRMGDAVLETNEDVYARIEQLIDEHMTDLSDEPLLATLRTRLRAEFSNMLHSEWGSERLEDIFEAMREGIVEEFEIRAEAILENAQ